VARKKQRRSSSREFRTHEEYTNEQLRIEMRLPSPPYPGHFRINVHDGGLYVQGDTDLAPEEALQVGKWLVEYYGSLDTTTEGID